ncbi:hypothetical protein AX16_008412 [Volvariella volvacea WC 439]|nr:hypothetical protein AX16_008412 [Volvariella volvacea WC 439]
MSHELDSKIQEIHKAITKERKILEASQHLIQATGNQDVRRRTEAKIRESEKSLAYFEETLSQLQARKFGAGGGEDAHRGAGAMPQTPVQEYNSRGIRSPGSPEMGPAGRSQRGGPPAPKQKPHNLDLIKADAPLTSAKITKMLNQLEFKYQVELQYKQGIEKMAKLYQQEGDKKFKVESESKRMESQQKIQLLNTALKRYRNLHVLDEAADEEDTGDNTAQDGTERKENIRTKPVSGTLYVTVKAARELDHAPIPTFGRLRGGSRAINETQVSIKVEGNQLARTHPSRTDRWNEDFEIPVDKASEVEVVVYDKQGDSAPVPIGLLWIRINDLVDALRRQKVAMESGQGAWLPANAMGGESPTSPMYPGGSMDAPVGPRGGTGAPGVPQGSEGVDAWFAVEPAGAIALHLNFVKENVRKRPLDAPLGGLGRQGALRKRKGEVHEMNGHKFVQRQFYQIMLCAFCNEFLLNALGYQCEDCRYTCHKKCYEKVVTKCISKSQTGEGDEEKINHRIPHRFEPITNIGANWCCHCGYMLPLGRKNARRCTECGITCHANCAHLVPDFCGMSMETANELLRSWRDINRARASRPSQPHKPQQDYTQPSLDTQMGRISLQGPEPPAPAPIATPVPAPPQVPPQEYGRPVTSPTAGHPQDPRYYNQSPPPQQPPQQPQQPYIPPQQPHAPRPPVGGRVPVPGYPEPAPPQHRPTYDIPPTHTPDGYPPSGYPGRPQSGGPGRQQTMPPVSPTGRPPSAGGLPPQKPPPQQAVARPKRKVGLDDFNFLAVLGKGNFGKVMLAEEKKTNGLYAIKVLKKEFIIDNDEVESTRSEKRVFLAAARERHPFLLGLHSCFQTETRVYFVMEYVSGGDLMLHIQRKQFSLRQAKFYASEVLLALEYFHSNGIIYRDLKLDNILLTLDGHVKVADYGLCKEEMWYGNTTSTFCGTPEFMAPEILLEQRYGRAVDWWAFGVLMYEMLLGQSPFRGDDEDEIFDAILEDEPLYPITMPRDAVSILQKLLTRDPTRRLGSGKDDAEEIKRQPFFKDVNWDDVINKRIPPPYFPTINGNADTSNFDEEFTREQPTLTPVHGKLSAQDQQEFNGFSWVASWADM